MKRPNLNTQSLHEEYEKHQIGNSMKIPRRISYGNRKVGAGDHYFSAGTEHFNPWPILQSRGNETQKRKNYVGGL